MLPAICRRLSRWLSQRVLTSGGQVSAEAGADVLAGLVTQAAGRITVMAGAGLGPANIAAVARRSGCTELHARRLRRSAMQFQNPLRGLDPDWSQTATATVAALRQALDGAR